MAERRPIRVLLSDDSVIVREGVRALLQSEPDVDVVGVAADYDELVAAVERTDPQVVVTDIRMPPTFQREGIDAANEIRRRRPGTGVVILSQYREPEYAISLLGQGSSGCAYLLKERVADRGELVRAIREVATGGSVVDPTVVRTLMAPVTGTAALTTEDEALLRQVAEGRSIKAIAATRGFTPAAIAEDVENLLLKVAKGASAGVEESVRRLRLLHQAIVEREEQGETLSRLLPGGVAEKLLREGWEIGRAETLPVTVLMSDVRGYASIAEGSDLALLAAQLSEHRAEMSRVLLAHQGTVMQFVGDAVLAVFGAPTPQVALADCALRAATEMHAAQASLNRRWQAEELPRFELGIGLSSGDVAAALLGSEERLEYSVVGDTVNLAQRLQQWAGPGETVVSEATYAGCAEPPASVRLGPTAVKGRTAPVSAYRIEKTTAEGV